MKYENSNAIEIFYYFKTRYINISGRRDQQPARSSYCTGRVKIFINVLHIHTQRKSIGNIGAMEREKIPVRNPRTGKEDYYITPPSQTRLAEECARIRKHQVAWAKAPISYRVEVLLRWANAIEANRKALADAECQDTGRRRLSHISINTFCRNQSVEQTR